MKISVVIPVYNEVRTVSTTVQIAVLWKRAHEVIVVDDGSTDETQEALVQFLPDIKLISLGRNRGKSHALMKGIESATGEMLVFLDADLTSLTLRDLDRLVEPIEKDAADMVLGVARFWSMGSYEPFNELTGQRVVRKKDIVKHLPKIKKLGYGVELYLNDLYKDKRIVSVRLPHVFIINKFEKQSVPDALVSYVKEARDLISQVIRQQADASPKTKKAFKTIQRYLKEAVDWVTEEKKE